MIVTGPPQFVGGDDELDVGDEDGDDDGDDVGEDDGEDDGDEDGDGDELVDVGVGDGEWCLFARCSAIICTVVGGDASE